MTNTTANLQRHFQPKQVKQPDKPSLSERLLGLFGKVRDRQQAEADERAANFRDLVVLLARHELGENVKLPTAEDVEAILKADGKSADELAAAVEKEKHIMELRAQLVLESDAIDALQETEESIARETKELEQLVAARTARIDQLDAERRRRQTDVETFRQLRNRLRSLAAEPNARVQQLTQMISNTVKEEASLRIQAGRQPLPEKFIEKPREFFEQEVLAAEAEVSKNRPTQSHVQNGPRLRAMMEVAERLQQEWPNTERLCKLGEKVRAVRARRAALIAERDALQTEKRDSRKPAAMT